jgi:hypothetical protein
MTGCGSQRDSNTKQSFFRIPAAIDPQGGARPSRPQHVRWAGRVRLFQARRSSRRAAGRESRAPKDARITQRGCRRTQWSAGFATRLTRRTVPMCRFLNVVSRLSICLAVVGMARCAVRAACSGATIPGKFARLAKTFTDSSTKKEHFSDCVVLFCILRVRKIGAENGLGIPAERVFAVREPI